jgi:light-regulated signal transduction histidine kinase (bacteriophytochrome)
MRSTIRQGELIKIKGTCQNITIRKEAELKTLETNAKLEAANKELEAFSYTVSHDLKSPVRQLASLVHLLTDIAEEKLNDDEKEILHSIGSAGQKMMTMIEELLKLSRLQKTQIDVEEIDLVEIFEQEIQELSSNEPERKVEFVAPKKLITRGDLKLVSILVQNILGNAWKYCTPKNITSIEIGKVEKDGREMIFIRDNGVGFDATKAEKIFMPFTRLHPEKEFQGSGIGLATVKRIVDRHGGSIQAESEPGKGATFCFSLSE